MKIIEDYGKIQRNTEENMRGKNMKYWRDILLICAGIVVGSLISSLTKGVKGLSWLSYGQFFGTKQPFTLDLGVISVTFGASRDITIATVIFVILIYVIGRKIIK